MNKIYKTLTFLAFALLAFGCNKTFEMDLPLAVNSRSIKLAETSGSTHILIYSDGDWTVKFTEPVEWASLDRLEGNGNSEIVLSYAANYGVARRLNIALAKGSLRDTIEIYQAGSIAEPELTWPCDSVSLCKDAGTVSFKVTSNLYYSLQNVTDSIYFNGDDAGWISDVAFDGRKISFKVSENASGALRRAAIDFNVLLPEAGETEDKSEVFSLIVSQDSGDGALELLETDMLDGVASTVSVETVTNNVWAYSGGVTFNVEYTPSVAEGEEWISGLALKEKNLDFKMADNMSGDLRTAKITVMYSGAMLAEKTVTQDVYPVVIPFEQLRGYAVGQLASREFIEGYVVSENSSENVCQNTQTAQFKFDFTESPRTAIVESTDGKYGFMLKFDSAEENTLQRYSKVRIKLLDLVLSKQDSPECYTLSGVRAENIISATEPNRDAVPAKRMSVADLQDSDIYTLVTLTDMEIVFKDGSYTNCTDGYSLKTSFNIAGTGSAPRWDVVPLLLTDKSGSTISMLTNSKVEWRRDGTGVAQGSGDYIGVVVAETFARYGDIGRYQIRPMVEEDIVLADAAFSKTLVEWTWNDAKADATPEIGEGSISGTGVSIALAPDFNALIPNNVTTSRTDAIASGAGGKGVVTNQAAYINNTWSVGSTFDVTFSTKGISGSNLQFGFVWGHGKGNTTTIDTPSHWKLSYSIDGGSTFKELAAMVKNRSLVWWTTTSQDAVPGLTEHMFKMPQECFGQDNVIVRFEVADNVCDKAPATAASTWKTNLGIEKGTFTTSKNPVRFGTITVRYN